MSSAPSVAPTDFREFTYEPIDAVESYEAPRPRNDRPNAPINKQHHCRCGRIFPDAHVVNGPPLKDRDAKCWSVQRRLYCDHCNHMVIWIEVALATGQPLGQKLTQPVVLKGRDYINQFLSAYPQARGVLS